MSDYTFEDILKRESTRAILMKFMTEEHGQENLQFWESIHLYKGYALSRYNQLVASSEGGMKDKDPKHATAVITCKEDLEKLSKQVYLKYLSADSAYEINIPKTIYKKVVNAVHGQIIVPDELAGEDPKGKPKNGGMFVSSKDAKEKRKIQKTLKMRPAANESSLDAGLFLGDNSTSFTNLSGEEDTVSRVSSNTHTSVSQNKSFTSLVVHEKCTQEDYGRILQLTEAFDEAFKHIAKLMESDTYRRFQKSPLFDQVDDIFYRKQKKIKKQEKMGKLAKFLKGQAGVEDIDDDTRSLGGDDDTNKGAKYDYVDILDLMS